MWPSDNCPRRAGPGRAGPGRWRREGEMCSRPGILSQGSLGGSVLVRAAAVAAVCEWLALRAVPAPLALHYGALGSAAAGTTGP